MKFLSTRVMANLQISPIGFICGKLKNSKEFRRIQPLACGCGIMGVMSLQLELKKLNFSDKEAKVYLALLELGEAPVQKIFEKAKVNRATTYIVLEALQKRGVVSTVEKDKKTVFAAESPRALLKLFRAQEQELKEKQNEFKKTLPELEALFNLSAEKPTVKFFAGPGGVRAVREDILQSGVKTLYNIYSKEYVDQIRALFGDDENEEFLKRERELGISIKSIYTSDSGPYEGFQLKGERKFVPKEKFPVSGDILIYEDRVALTTLRGKIVSVIIESREIAGTLRTIFELAWRGTDKI